MDINVKKVIPMATNVHFKHAYPDTLFLRVFLRLLDSGSLFFVYLMGKHILCIWGTHLSFCP